MARWTKTAIIALVVVSLLVGLWYMIWVLPDVPQKSIRGYFSSIMDENYERAWGYIFPGSEFMRERGGPTLDKNKFITELANARARGTKITKYFILGSWEEADPLEKIDAGVVRVMTENLVSGNPKTSDPKDYYLKKDKDGIWKIYKGSVPKQ